MQSNHDLSARAVPIRSRIDRTFARWLLAAVALAGCGGLEPVEPYSPTTDPAALFMALTFDHGAINLATVAPHDKLQLTATPRDGLGSPMMGLPAPTFRSSDTTRVFVTPQGELQARKAGTGIQVIAELVADGNVRHADTAFVNVTASTNPQMLATLSIQPQTPQAAVWGMLPFSGTLGRLLFQFSGVRFDAAVPLRLLDANGAAIPGLVVRYQSLNPDVATINSRLGNIGMLQPAEVTMVVRTTAYGISKADTARFTVTLPIVHGVVVNAAPNGGVPVTAPRTVTIRPGGYVFWSNLSADSVSVTFDDPSAAGQIAQICTAQGATRPVHCDSGNIPNFMSKTNDFWQHTRGRQFVQPGSYPYRIEPLGVTGRVIVANDVQ